MSKEIAKVVQELNEHIFEISENFEYTLWFEHISLPVGDYVKYAGQYIFDSENDYRPYTEDEDGEEVQQDLKEYLLEQVSLIKSSIYKTMKKVERV